MNPVRFWFAIFAMLGLVIVVPGWMYFVNDMTGSLNTEIQFLLLMVLPFTILFTMASWISPGGTS